MITEPTFNLLLRRMTALDDFAAELRGELMLPDQPAYDSARRVWMAWSTTTRR